MDRQKELNRIAGEIARCPECKKGGTGKPVPGEGSGEACVMFVGEAPGRLEAESGRPFIGRSGRFLRTMIANIGLEDSSVFLTSPVHYRPLRGAPTTAMIGHGRVHLLEQISVIRPRLVVLLGNTACRALLGATGMARRRGRLFSKDGIDYFLTYHPAYADRFPEGRKKFARDFARLKRLLEMNAFNFASGPV